jgi:putative endonuclease
MKPGFVYIMSSVTRTIYIGVTSDLQRRVWEHKSKQVEGFTKRYRCTRLVYFEELSDMSQAIQRETTLKGWLRKRKVELVEKENPKWLDLAERWFEAADSSLRSE